MLCHVVNVLYPGTKKGNAYASAYVLLTPKLLNMNARV